MIGIEIDLVVEDELQPFEATAPLWATAGQAVLYRPSDRSDETFRGVVAGEARFVGGSWHVSLEQMEPSFGRYEVRSALVRRLEPIGADR